jgi:hypothetical protein
MANSNFLAKCNRQSKFGTPGQNCKVARPKLPRPAFGYFENMPRNFEVAGCTPQKYFYPCAPGAHAFCPFFNLFYPCAPGAPQLCEAARGCVRHACTRARQPREMCSEREGAWPWRPRWRKGGSARRPRRSRRGLASSGFGDARARACRCASAKGHETEKGDAWQCCVRESSAIL